MNAISFPEEVKAAVSTQTRLMMDRTTPARTKTPSDLAKPIEQSLENRVYQALVDAKVLTSQVAMHLDGETRKKLFRQLDLIHDLEEWEKGDRPLLQESFLTFLRTLLFMKIQRRPGLGLSYTGNLLASWVAGENRLTLECHPGDNLRWLVSYKANGEAERAAGDVKPKRLLAVLAAYQPEQWFFHGDAATARR